MAVAIAAAAAVAWCAVATPEPPATIAPTSAPHRQAAATALASTPRVDARPAAARAGDRDPIAAADTAAAAAPRPPTRVVVVVEVDGDAGPCGAPTPELLRLDDLGRASTVGAPPAPPRHPALLAADAADGRAAGPARATRTFEVTGPGRYVAAWHAWRQVPRTSTWRVQRGRGAEFTVSGGEPMRAILVRVPAAELEPDPALDRPAPGARYHFTPKDG